MSTKHNTKHLGRGNSKYKDRLQARGIQKSPMMSDPRLSDNKLASASR